MVGQSQARGHEPLLCTTAADPRADRGRREIAVSEKQVTIRRRLHGIDMRLSLAISAYAGVALCLRAGDEGALVYQVRLVHRDHDLSVVLDEAADDNEIVADWRLWARVLGLPALVERELGHFEPLSGNSDASEAAARCIRRKRPLKRRPRILASRKACLPGSVLVIHAHEREIIART